MALAHAHLASASSRLPRVFEEGRLDDLESLLDLAFKVLLRHAGAFPTSGTSAGMSKMDTIRSAKSQLPELFEDGRLGDLASLFDMLFLVLLQHTRHLFPEHEHLQKEIQTARKKVPLLFEEERLEDLEGLLQLAFKILLHHEDHIFNKQHSSVGSSCRWKTLLERSSTSLQEAAQTKENTEDLKADDNVAAPVSNSAAEEKAAAKRAVMKRTIAALQKAAAALKVARRRNQKNKLLGDKQAAEKKGAAKTPKTPVKQLQNAERRMEKLQQSREKLIQQIMANAMQKEELEGKLQEQLQEEEQLLEEMEEQDAGELEEDQRSRHRAARDAFEQATQQAKEVLPLCQQGHVTTKQALIHARACDICTTILHKGVIIWRCAPCEFDLCDNCAVDRVSRGPYRALVSIVHREPAPRLDPQVRLPKKAAKTAGDKCDVRRKPA
mmetsp:Transcript_31509/g.57251  ORF Transcript_31509/g.57251 Transcript_31509/m.57251 type:complete len:439 (-) Transcript_31509:399-1715(-)